MTKRDPFETLRVDQLAHTIGGAGMDIGSLIQQAGSMADQAGAGGKGSQIAGMIGPMAQNIMGMVGKG